jgi:Kef-type K+ transport system membrane component KefB
MLGEILAGVIIGPSVLSLFHESATLTTFAEIGIIFMIFMLGLETKVANLRAVGAAAAAIAMMGVALPFLAGWGLGEFMNEPWQTSLFFGAILTATSVAVTARTFIDMDLTRSKLAQIVLAAAVVDDIVGLLALTLVISVTGAGGGGGIWETVAKSAFFLLVIFPVFWFIIPPVTHWLRRLEGEGSLFVMVLGLTFLFSFLAASAGLAGIVGAFLIGLIFGRTSEAASIQEQVEPIFYFMAPIFFVSIGIGVHLGQLSDVIIFALAFTAIAIVTKIIGGLAGGMMFRLPVSSALLVGVGLIPRGEVGLIVAELGRRDGIINEATFSAAAFMCVATILVTPSLLKWMLAKFHYEEER